MPDADSYPGRYLVERRCSSCAPLGEPVAGSGEAGAAAMYAQELADEEGHVVWIRDRWVGTDRGDGESRGRVIWVVFPERASGFKDRIEDLID